MYIDSPTFVKRKVMVNANPTDIGEQYHFGAEREQLARHVHNQINEHSDDHLILERFRKEAQQLKRQRFQAKRRPPPSMIAEHRSEKYELQPLQRAQPHENPQIQPTYSRMIDEVQKDGFSLNKIQHFGHHNRQEDNVAYHYQKLLNSKQKELRKKQKKLQKSKIVIEKMSSKIHSLKQEKRIAVKEQEMEMMKINALIEEMNYKIAENKMNFREELARLKLEMVDPTSNFSTVSARRTVNQKNLSIPLLPKPGKIQRRHDSERFLQGPSLYYEVPVKQTVDFIQSQIDTNIESADRGLKRIKDSQLFLENQFGKYKEL